MDKEVKKICNKCKRTKSATSEYFHKDKTKKDGLATLCKLCKNHSSKIHYKKNKDYYTTYQQENKNTISIKKKIYRQENRQSLYEQKKKYKKENEDLVFKQRQSYRKRRSHIIRQAKQRRLAKKNQVVNTFTIDDWSKTKTHFKNSCAYCGMTEREHLISFGQQLHQDHFIPLSKGGGYSKNNILPSCRSCNCSKNDSDFNEWYPTCDNYSVDNMKFILNYILHAK